MAEERRSEGNIDLAKWILNIEKRLSRLEGEMKIVILMLTSILGVLVAVLSKI